MKTKRLKLVAGFLLAVALVGTLAAYLVKARGATPWLPTVAGS